MGSSVRWNPALVLLVALSACRGCPGDDEDFDRVAEGVGDDDDDTADDDDSSADDDDTATPSSEPPRLAILSPLEIEGALAGLVPVQYKLTDPDSTQVNVTVRFGVDGVPTAAATLDSSNPQAQFVSSPDEWELQSFELVWDSPADIPTFTENAVLELCAQDAEGNQGPESCASLPLDGELTVFNSNEPNDGALCAPGVLEEMNWFQGETLVQLSDGSCLNYELHDPPQPTDFSAQFLLVLVNPTQSDASFTITAVGGPDAVGTLGDDDDSVGDDDDSAGDDDDSAGPPPAPAPRRRSHVATEADLAVAAAREAQHAAAPGGMGSAGIVCTPDLSPLDVHNDNRNFFVRNTIAEGASRSARGANLRALGQHVAIYVDDETPIDVDRDCADPNNPIEQSDLPAFGFNNCQLDEVVRVVDDNIVPTLSTLFGDIPDVDGNCRLTVLVSHRLNKLTTTNSDSGDDSRIVRSIAEPDVDLWSTDLTLNPGSNEQEILYLYAPDPAGFWNDTTVAIDEWVTYRASGQIAVALQDVISYAAHRGIGKRAFDPGNETDEAAPEPEEDWLNDALGLLAADVTGFGSIGYLDAWIYMDRSHLLPITSENTLQDFEDRGGQYLFARYLHDLFGDPVIWNLIHAVDADGVATRGFDALTAVLEPAGYPEFEQFAMQWGTALAISGRTQPDDSGLPLVADAVVPNYRVSTNVAVANPQNPQPGELYGANGFQRGFNVRGINRTWTGGADPGGPTELSIARVMTENLDPLVYHPQADFFGKVAGDFGVAVILVSGLEQPQNWLLIETQGDVDLLGRVIRIDDAHPLSMPLTLEDVDGAKITTRRDLGLLNALGSTERRVVGRVDPAETIHVSPSVDPPTEGDDDDVVTDDDDAEPEVDELAIDDIDRFGFQLDALTTVAIWVDRRMSGLNGAVSLGDPFLAVAPASDVPNAFEYGQWGFGPTPSDGPCSDPSIYNYPIVMPDWLALQANLLANPSINEEFDWVVEEFDPTLTCEFDHDQDGIADVFEVEPASIIDQILLRQLANLTADPTFYQSTFGSMPGAPDVSQPWYSAAFVDVDSNEDPDDSFATAFPGINVGGRAVSTGEEAVWVGVLPAGDYTVLVGDGSGGTGPYDLSLRAVQLAP